MFSVVIPLYNKEKYIAKALNSVIAQSFTDYEIIVVNDGSTDNSLKFVEQISATSDIQINIITQTNQGVSAARNKGVSVAKYDYIAFLDADDWWKVDFLETHSRLLKLYPDAVAYGSGYYIVKNGSLRMSQISYKNDYEGYIDYFDAYTYKWNMPLTSISVVINKKQFVKQNGFNVKLCFGEDFNLWIRLVLSGNIVYANKPLAYYNQDVEINERALGGKIWIPEKHYIFNLDFLKEEEKENPKLKKLLDGLRVRALLRYYLANKYRKETRMELQKVDFKLQNTYFKFIYKSPRLLVVLYFALKNSVYRIVQKLK